ncbi:hypothetical protein [Paenibacillus ginsengihumi]|uniref:hypothetical protein n=1 Tax=Paenibacillus ginsengihumi TaxID=431596 RepID=UPI001FE1906F|nr:hypothetical protein [Paenibacillus ginsengihumi]
MTMDDEKSAFLRRRFVFAPIAARAFSNPGYFGNLPTVVAVLVRVCDGANFDQLIEICQVCYADEAAGRPMLFHVFLEKPNDGREHSGTERVSSSSS